MQEVHNNSVSNKLQPTTTTNESVNTPPPNEQKELTTAEETNNTVNSNETTHTDNKAPSDSAMECTADNGPKTMNIDKGEADNVIKGVSKMPADTTTETSSQNDAAKPSPSQSLDTPANQTPPIAVATEETKEEACVIEYNEGQWSPLNPMGKKQYNRQQLMQLRDAQSSRIQPEVKNTSILTQSNNNLMPSFVRNSSNKKYTSGSMGNNRGDNFNNYKKSASGRGGGGDGSGQNNRSGSKNLIHINLSLNEDIKLNETDNAWRPRLLAGSDMNAESDEAKAEREKEDLMRRVRGILNKLTPEKFEPLVEQIIKLKIDTMDKMEAVMILVFEKAIDEPSFAVSYARLCHRLINEVKARDEQRMESSTKTNLAHFRNTLLDKTEKEFTSNVTKQEAKEEKLKPIKEAILVCEDPNEKIELEAQLEEEERKIRRRSGGTVRFIGELFKISILTGKIINSCIEALLKDHSNEDMLECLCKLLTTVGQKYEQTPIPKDEKKRCYSLDSVMLRMQAIATKSDNSKVSSRVRFMLQDVIDLRKKKWQSTRNEAPKTMQQIEKEANIEQLSSQFMNVGMGSQNSGVGSGKRNDDRPMRYNNNNRSSYSGSHSQRGDKRQQHGGGGGGGNASGNANSDDTWHVQTGKGSRPVDSNKLEGLMTNFDLNNKKMGGVSQFQWKSSSIQPTTTPSNSFAALSLLDTTKSSSMERNPLNSSGPRNNNKGGPYNRGSMERDRYRDRGLITRSNSSQNSRENSSSRGMSQGHRGGVGSNSMTSKSASNSKYSQHLNSPRAVGAGNKGGMSYTNAAGLYGSQQRSNMPDSRFGTADSGKLAQTKSLAEEPFSFEEPSSADLKIIKSVLNEIMENALSHRRIDQSTVSCIERIENQLRCGLLYYILTDYLHLASVGSINRRHLSNVVAYMLNNKLISVELFRLAYENFAALASDLMVDIPELWLYTFEFVGPLLAENLITINDLWIKQLKEQESPSLNAKFLKTFIQYCTREVGPRFTRAIWKKYNIKWTDFIDESEVSKFIESNKFEYVENAELQPEFDLSKEPLEKRYKRVVDNIGQMLKKQVTAEQIIDYIDGNVPSADKTFIKHLTTTLTSHAINDATSNITLNVDCFQKICVPVLNRYLAANDDLELECLFAILALVHELEHPRGLMSAIFGELNDADVIAEDSFKRWRDSKGQYAGKGVAVKALNQFFEQVIDGETSDDN